MMLKKYYVLIVLLCGINTIHAAQDDKKSIFSLEPRYQRNTDPSRFKPWFNMAKVIMQVADFCGNDHEDESIRKAATALSEIAMLGKLTHDLLDQDRMITVYTYHFVKKVIYLASMVDDLEHAYALNDPRGKALFNHKPSAKQAAMLAVEVLCRASLVLSSYVSDLNYPQEMFEYYGTEAADWLEIVRLIDKMRTRQQARLSIASGSYEPVVVQQERETLNEDVPLQFIGHNIQHIQEKEDVTSNNSGDLVMADNAEVVSDYHETETLNS